MSDLLLLERMTPLPAHRTLPSEVDVHERMKRYGIYNERGNQTSYKYVDLVAWGCVVLDVKESKGNGTGNFKFRLRSHRKAKHIRAHLYVFVCNYGTHKTYHVFPADHAVFIKPDGEMKRAVCFNANPQFRRKQYGEVLTPALMDLHKDAWYYVEVERKALSQRLIAQGAQELQRAA